MFCPKCGTQNIDDAKFCRGCGADIALVPQALNGHLPETRADHQELEELFDERIRRRHRRRDGQPRLDKAISNFFTGIGFLLVAFSVMLFAPTGRMWWFWMLIPAFSMLGGGIAEYVRYKQSKGEEVKLPGVESKKAVAPPARVSALPPRNTSELVTPPSSVTEGTTRHLDMSKEALPRRASTTAENSSKDI